MSNTTIVRTNHEVETVKDGDQVIAGCACGFTYGGHFDSQEMAYAAVFTHIACQQ